MVARVVPDPTGDAIRRLFSAVADARKVVVGGDPSREVGIGPLRSAEAALVELRSWAATIDSRLGGGDTVFDELATVAGLLASAGVKLTYIRHVRFAAEGRQSTTAGACQACGRDVAGTEMDRLRSGYCMACNYAWGQTAIVYPDGSRGLRQDRGRFERDRRQQLVALAEKEIG